MLLASCVPLYLAAGKEVEETLRIVDAQTQEAAAKKQVVEGEEAIASEKAAAAKAIKVNTRCSCCLNGVVYILRLLELHPYLKKHNGTPAAI